MSGLIMENHIILSGEEGVLDLQEQRVLKSRACNCCFGNCPQII